MKLSTFAIDDKLKKAIADLNYEIATVIQQQAIPEILAKSDVMARAQTGTGKTAAFALPILDKILKQKTAVNEISCLVVLPTRELAQQVNSSFQAYSKYCQVKSAMVFGGVSIKPQLEQLNEGVDILIATPGRLIDLLQNHDLNLKNINTLVLDEADRILDLGFQKELEKVFEFLPENKQTLLFSATFTDAIYKVSKQILKEPVIISIDQNNQVAEGVEQVVYTVDADRKRELTSYIIGSKNWHQVLVFVRTKQGADSLAKEMCKDGIKTSVLHGDKSQGTRNKALSADESPQNED